MQFLNIIDINVLVGNILSGLIIGVFTFLGARSAVSFEKWKYGREEQKEKNRNKAEFRVKVSDFIESELDIKAIWTPFEHKIDNGNLEILYPDDIVKKENLIYEDYEFTNIGLTTVDHFIIATSNLKQSTLAEYEGFEFYSDHKLMNYAIYHERRTLSNESIKVRIYYHKDLKPITFISANMIIMYQDDNGTYWEQPFFNDKVNTYRPKIITNKDVRIYTNLDTAYKCFENPMLW